MNQELLQITNPSRDGRLVSVKSEIINEVDSYGSEGEEGERYRIFKVIEDNTYLKFTWFTNSYGYEYSNPVVEFVKPVEKTFIDYEVI